MSTASKAGPGQRPPQNGNDRLDSWKEIAAHFGRGITTLQRWEREESLPVHRLQHDKQGSVFAYREELDAWWSSRRAEDEKSREFLTIRIRRRTLAVSAALALGVAVAGAAAVIVSLRPQPANLCRHPADLGNNRITAFAEFDGRLYAIYHRPATGGRWAVQSIDDPAKGAGNAVVYRGDAHVESIVGSVRGLYTVLFHPTTRTWSAYRSDGGRDLAGGVTASLEYSGDARVDALAAFGDGIMTALSGSAKDDPCGIYFSPYGKRLAATSDSQRRYNGRYRVDRMAVFRGGLMTAFVDERSGVSQGIYFSRTGSYPGVVNGDTAVVASPLTTGVQVERLVETSRGIVAAFYNPGSRRNWGIYLSPDGHTLAGGGRTWRTYEGPSRSDAILGYGDGIITASYDPFTGNSTGIYFSPDGRNLGGGGSTIRTYSGPLRVSALARFHDGVVGAFFDPKTGEGRGMSFSRDGRGFPDPR